MKLTSALRKLPALKINHTLGNGNRAYTRQFISKLPVYNFSFKCKTIIRNYSMNPGLEGELHELMGVLDKYKDRIEVSEERYTRVKEYHDSLEEHLRNKNYDLFLSKWREYEKDVGLSDEGIFNLLLQFSIETTNFEDAKRVLHEILALKFKVNRDLIHEYLNLALLREDIDELDFMFKFLKRIRYTISPSILTIYMTAYSEKDITKCKYFYSLSSSYGFEPDIPMDNILLSAFFKLKDYKAAKAFFESRPNIDAETIGIMISYMCFGSNNQNPMIYYDILVDKKLKPNATVLHFLILYYCLHTDLININKCIQMIEEFEVTPYKETLDLAYHALSTDYDLIQQVTVRFLTSQYVKLDTSHLETLVRLCCEKDNPNRAWAWVIQFRKAEVQLDTKIYSMLISSFAKKGSTDISLNLYKHMVKSHVVPDYRILLALVFAHHFCEEYAALYKVLKNHQLFKLSEKGIAIIEDTIVSIDLEDPYALQRFFSYDWDKLEENQ